MSKCSFCWMISAFRLCRNSVSPLLSISSIGTNCSTCLSRSGGGGVSRAFVSPSNRAMQSRRSVRTGRICAAASGQKPTHTSSAPTSPEGGGHLNVTERKHARRQRTPAAVTRVKAEKTGSSRVSPERRVCRENTRQPKNCCWYQGSPSWRVMLPFWGNEGAAENLKVKFPRCPSQGLHAEGLPNTKHCLFIWFPTQSPAKLQRPATSDKMEAAQSTWQDPQGDTQVQSMSAPIRASFKWFSSPPSQNGEFLTAGSAEPTIMYQELTWHTDRGPSRTQFVPAALAQCVCIQVAWQPLLMRSLQLREFNSLRSLNEPVWFFWFRGRPTGTTQQAGVTVLRETHRFLGRKLTCDRWTNIIYSTGYKTV